MFRTGFVVAVISAGFVVAIASEAAAQRPSRSVSRPALSPYSNMFRMEMGMTDPYTSLLRPYMQQNQQQRAPTRQGAATSAMSAQSTESLRAHQRSAQQQAGGIAPTGTGSVFMNMGHFYQTRNFRR